MYVHAKVVVVDDVWAMIGSDNLNRRSWTHDSELSCAVLDATRDEREPRDPAGLGDGARVFARELRLRLWREHLELDADRAPPVTLSTPSTRCRATSSCGHEPTNCSGGTTAVSGGSRPPGRLRPHSPERLARRHRPWAVPVYRFMYDPDGRAIRDRLRRRP